MLMSRVTSVLISRSMLSLREIIADTNGDNQTTGGIFSSIPVFDMSNITDRTQHYSSIAGSMGASLDHSALWMTSPSDVTEKEEYQDTSFELEQQTSLPVV